MEINEKLIEFEKTFWSDLADIVKTVENDQLECCLIKLCVHLELGERRKAGLQVNFLFRISNECTRKDKRPQEMLQLQGRSSILRFDYF